MKTTPQAAFALLIALALSANAADWPHWRGPDYNGISKQAGWSANWTGTSPKQLWKAKVGTGFASFAVSKGRAYTTGNAKDEDTVFCFDANTGEEIWKHSYPAKLDPKYYEGGTRATPTVDDDRVFTFSKRGMVHCLDAARGTVIWSKNLAEEVKAEMPTWGFAGSVLIEGDLAILNIGSAGAGLDKKTGKVVWSSGTAAGGYSSGVPFGSGSERARDDGHRTGCRRDQCPGRQGSRNAGLGIVGSTGAREVFKGLPRPSRGAGTVELPLLAGGAFEVVSGARLRRSPLRCGGVPGAFGSGGGGVCAAAILMPARGKRRCSKRCPSGRRGIVRI